MQIIIKHIKDESDNNLCWIHHIYIHNRDNRILSARKLDKVLFTRLIDITRLSLWVSLIVSEKVYLESYKCSESSKCSD